MSRGAPARIAAHRTKPLRLHTSCVNNVGSRRLRRMLALRRGSSGTVYDGPFDLEDEEDRRLYVRWFRINYPVPEGLVSKNETFFGVHLSLSLSQLEKPCLDPPPPLDAYSPM